MFIQDYNAHFQKTIGKIPLDKVREMIRILNSTRNQGRSIFVCGNGGSASTASHFACDMVKGASRGKLKFRIQCLADSLPTITAYSNDLGYEHVFVEQLKNFAKQDDVFIAISGSGNSSNVIRAVEYANSIGCYTVGLSGFDGGKLARISKLNVNVPEQHMGRSEEAHLHICHLVSYYFMNETT